MLSSGFTNAPITKYLVILLVAVSLLASITEGKHVFWIAIRPHLIDYRQLWRLLIWQLSYANSTEVLFAAATVYGLRVVERIWGSRKFVSFLIVVYAYTTFAVPLVVACILRPLSWGHFNYIPSGPTALVFAILAQYHAAIPYEYKYRLSVAEGGSTGSFSSASAVAGDAIGTRNPFATSLNLTSKSTSYLLPMQLALSQLPGSAVVAAVGWLVGYAYRLDLLPGGASAWRIPVLGGKRRERERVEGLRRRMMGEAAGMASGTDGGAAAAAAAAVERDGEGARRRTLGGQIIDQFRGAL